MSSHKQIHFVETAEHKPIIVITIEEFINNILY